MIWSDSFLNQLAEDAESQINYDVQCIFYRFFLPTTVGLSVYTLPSFVRSLLRITWRGKSLDPVSWEELQLLTPATVFVNSQVKIESVISKPLQYALHPTNPYDIRIFPTPNESLGTVGDPYSPTPNEPFCTVTCFRSTDSNNLLPTYIDRRTRKAFVLWKAFEAEGKGQNKLAAKYYKQKYQFLIERFRSINESCFVAKRYSLDDGMLTIDGFRYPRPIHSTNFERTIF